MSASIRRRVGLVLGVLVVGACGDSEPAGMCEAVDKSQASISEGAGPWERQGRDPELVELWRAGGLEDGQGMVLPVEIAPSQDGRIAIPDFRAGHTFVVSPDGTWLGSWTPQGEGPAEVLRPVAAQWTDGLLGVFDIQGSKVAWLEGPAEAVDQRSLDPDFTAPVIASGSLRWAAVGPDGTTWLRTGPESAEAGSRGALDVVTRLPVSAETPDTVLLDTVPTVATKGRFARTILPGAPRPVATVGPDGTLWFADPGGRYVLHRQTSSEARSTPVLCRVERPWMLTARERAERDVPDEGEKLAGAIRDASEPDRLAAVGRILVGRGGRIWVQRKRPTPFGRDVMYGPPGGEWDVFTEDGDFLGEVDAPPGARLQASAGDTVWAFEIGELDEVWVVAYELRLEGGRR